ncbi:DUF292-domain-containing protein [Macrolepiota fuliginosa MF-IS2]|uniref:DUF292-domain-containing protein n=1 Tax=Macrolepiota fuliginosa MF-IS2 TaxID=1400762 RepID=A0A9P5X7K6_9AGAR|nr:DUF292-domain-containing protein [Macrolepiota fuliginosa MF-IS2]
MIPWNSAKAKVIQRLRTLQQKKEAQAKVSRRDIATLLERGKVETARIKVESLINEDIHVELLELLELYCELLLARFGLLDQNAREPDPAVNEGVCSVIYAAPRTELKELHVLRDILMHKYGREFSVGVMENRDNRVSDRVTRKLVVDTPSKELVDGYLREIARGYGVPWSSDPSEPVDSEKEKAVEDGSRENKSPDENTERGEKGVDSLPSAPTPKKVEEEEDTFDALAKRFAELKKR